MCGLGLCWLTWTSLPLLFFCCIRAGMITCCCMITVQDCWMLLLACGGHLGLGPFPSSLFLALFFLLLLLRPLAEWAKRWKDSHPHTMCRCLAMITFPSWKVAIRTGQREWYHVKKKSHRASTLLPRFLTPFYTERSLFCPPSHPPTQQQHISAQWRPCKITLFFQRCALNLANSFDYIRSWCWAKKISMKKSSILHKPQEPLRSSFLMPGTTKSPQTIF